MHNYTISRSRLLCAQSRRNRAAFEHVIATTRQVIRDSQLLIHRATQMYDSSMVGSAVPAKPDVHTDKE
jgi:hypothetical protein